MSVKAVVLLMGLFVIAGAQWSVAAAVTDKKIVVVDDMGRRIELNHGATRVISLAPHITENLFTVGAGEQLVGVVNYSDFPAAATAIRSVGSYKQFNLEVIAALQPDLIIGWASGNGMGKLQQLIDLGFTVYISNPETVLSIADTLERFAELTNNLERGRQAAAQFRDTVAQLQGDNQQQKSLSVFYQVWNKPLQTLNGKHMISDVIRLCGGNNAFADAAVIAPKIGVESVLAANPHVIIASGMGEERPEWLDQWRDWPALRAVKNDNLYFIPPDHLQRHTVRLLLGASQMCEQFNAVRKKAAAGASH